MTAEEPIHLNVQETQIRAPVSRLDRITVLMALFTISLLAVAIVTFSVSRQLERQSFNHQLDEVLNELNIARKQRDELAVLADRAIITDRTIADKAECEARYARAITRATDALNRAETAVFVALLGDDDRQFRVAVDQYEAAADQFSVAVVTRDDYVAGGSQLPCPVKEEQS